MSARYGWRPGSHIRLDAQRAGEELEAVRKCHNGRLEPENVLDAAKSKRSPLHAHFEWDDAVAANEYRLNQAGELIRSLTVDISGSNLEVRTTRAFVNVEVDGDRHYTSIETAMSSEELRAQVLERAWRELKSWQDRHVELVEFAKFFSLIDKGPPPPKK